MESMCSFPTQKSKNHSSENNVKRQAESAVLESSVWVSSAVVSVLEKSLCFSRIVLLLHFTSPHRPFKVSCSIGSEKTLWMDAALGVGKLLNITKDRGKISSLCWLLSMNPRARLNFSSLWFSKNILSIVQRHFRHCRDQHLVKLLLCKTIIWKSVQSSATGFLLHVNPI